MTDTIDLPGGATRTRTRVHGFAAAIPRGEAPAYRVLLVWRSWRLNGGRAVPGEFAQIAVKSNKVADVGDALAIDGAPQTWRCGSETVFQPQLRRRRQ